MKGKKTPSSWHGVRKHSEYDGMICQQQPKLVKPVQSLLSSISVTTKQKKKHQKNLFISVFTSRVVHVHKEHVLVPVQDGVKLQTKTNGSWWLISFLARLIYEFVGVLFILFYFLNLPLTVEKEKAIIGIMASVWTTATISSITEKCAIVLARSDVSLSLFLPQSQLKQAYKYVLVRRFSPVRLKPTGVALDWRCLLGRTKNTWPSEIAVSKITQIVIRRCGL